MIYCVITNYRYQLTVKSPRNDMKELLQTEESVDLIYDDGCEALAGRIKDLSVVIKENPATRTYGAIIWVINAKDPSAGGPDALLAAQAASKPHIIKHYKTTGRGAAVALVKYNDALRNIRNIKRFMGEISDDLRANSYVNCCYKCGTSSGLGIYDDNGVPVQYCRSCASGRLIRGFEDTAPPVSAVPPEKQPESTVPPFSAAVPVHEENRNAEPERAAAPISDDAEVNGLLANTYDTTEYGSISEHSEHVISTDSDHSDISGFMVTETEEEKKEPPVSEIFAAAQKEFDEEKARQAQQEEHADNSLDSLMYVGGGDDEKLTASWDHDTSVKPENVSGAADDPALGSLMFDENDTPPAEEKITHEEYGIPEEYLLDSENSPEEQPDDPAYDNEQALRAADVIHLEKGEKLVTEITSLTSIGGRDIEVIDETDEPVGEDENVTVTELVDDSNEGEDVEITALDPTLGKPTDNTGEDIKASDVPLDKNGNVPLINPSAGFSGVSPSIVSGSSQVRAYVGGTYDNATASDEPVGFDGRRKGDTLRGDPRAGDDGFEKNRRTGIEKVTELKRAKPDQKINLSRATVNTASYHGGSNPAVGTIAALLFGIIGCALWAGSGYLFDLVGINDEIGSLITSFLALLVTVMTFLGYRVGGDCFDTKGIVISSVVSVILDVAGATALFITSEFRWSSANLTYTVPFDIAFERMMKGIAGDPQGPLIYGKLMVIGGIMIVSLIAAIFIAKKKS